MSLMILGDLNIDLSENNLQEHFEFDDILQPFERFTPFLATTPQNRDRGGYSCPPPSAHQVVKNPETHSGRLLIP